MTETDWYAILPPGTRIPKPKHDVKVVRWTKTRDGEHCFVYEMPSANRSRKTVRISELRAAEERIRRTGVVDRPWFRRTLPKTSAAAPCNFTTMGGALEIAGLAAYEGRRGYFASASTGDA